MAGKHGTTGPLQDRSVDGMRLPNLFPYTPVECHRQARGGKDCLGLRGGTRGAIAADSASGKTFLDPGWYEKEKLNHLNSRAHLACLELRCLAVGAEILQVLMVGPHDEWVFHPFQTVPPFLQHHLLREKLTIPQIVVIFRGVEVVGEEGAGM